MPVETVIYTTLRGDDEPVEEIPAELIRYTYRLNRPGSIQFALSLDHPFCTRSVIYPGVHEAVIVRNRQIVWRGPVLTANEVDDQDQRMVEFGGEGLLHYPNRWYLTQDRTFTQQDQFTIARALVNSHQNKAGGDFSIDTSGVDLSGVLRDRTYVRGKNIGEALLELADVNDGFDFQIDAETRLLELFHPQQGARFPDLIIEDGIRQFSRSVDSTSQASQVVALGEGEGDSQVFATRQSSTAVAEYGLTQMVYDNQEVSIRSTLIGHADFNLAHHRNPVQDLRVTVGTGEFNPFQFGVGVEGRVKYDSSYDEVNEVRRLVGFDVVWNQGDEQAVLALAPVVS